METTKAAQITPNMVRQVFCTDAVHNARYAWHEAENQVECEESIFGPNSSQVFIAEAVAHCLSDSLNAVIAEAFNNYMTEQGLQIIKVR